MKRRLRKYLFLSTLSFLLLLLFFPSHTTSPPKEALGEVDFESLDTLVVVACHAVRAIGSLDKVERDDSKWLLLDYQKNQDFPSALLAHVRKGVAVAASEPSSLLVFSGGQTREEAGPRSESESYFEVAEHFAFFNSRDSVKQRTFLEEFATDSFQNLLFSICRFREVTGHYPRKIHVVSFSFKERRFRELHRRALQFPTARFFFHGSDPQKKTMFRGSHFDLERFSRFERTLAVAPFESDPFGCSSPVLLKKRRERNPFRRTAPYKLSCPELEDLLDFCGPEDFGGSLPWT